MSSSGLISGLAPDLKQVRIYVVPSQTSPDLRHNSNFMLTTTTASTRPIHAAPLALTGLIVLVTLTALPHSPTRSARAVTSVDTLPALPAGGDCTAYFQSDDCEWTVAWACPPAVGSGGTAGDDGSEGFYCCCVLEQMPPPPRPPARPPPPPPAARDCTAYFQSDDCEWTVAWACPPAVGSGGTAGDDGSEGFYCCCVLEQMPPPPRPPARPLPPPPAARDCTAYFQSDDCEWTVAWACPPAVGSGGTAGDDGSEGFYCCCVLSRVSSPWDPHLIGSAAHGILTASSSHLVVSADNSLPPPSPHPLALLLSRVAASSPQLVVSADKSPRPPSPHPPALLPAAKNYDENEDEEERGVLTGVTNTAVAIFGEEGEEGERGIVGGVQDMLIVLQGSMPPSAPCPAHLEEPFALLLFNETCLHTAHLPFTCGTRIADLYVHEVAKALTVDSLLARQLSVVCMFTLNQLGGVPVPRPGCHVSVACFWTWMGLQALQYVMAFHLVAIEVVSFISVREGMCRDVPRSPPPMVPPASQ
jgi:hypothetical protein